MPESVAAALGAVAPDFQRWLASAVAEHAAARVDPDADGFREDLAELKRDVAAIKLDVAELKSDVAAIKVDITQMRSDIGVLDTRVRGVEAELVELRSDVRELRAEFADFRTATEARFDSMSAQLLQGTRWSVGVLALFGTMVMALLAIQTIPLR
jgi:septal ring factor EnvC (AmiA/AmiB activator)